MSLFLYIHPFLYFYSKEFSLFEYLMWQKLVLNCFAIENSSFSEWGSDYQNFIFIIIIIIIIYMCTSSTSSSSISRPPEFGGRRPSDGPVIRVFLAITALRRCLLKPSRSSLRLPMVLVFNRLRRTKNAAVVVVVVDTTNNHAITTRLFLQ